MAETQGEGGDPKTMEETKDHIPESAKDGSDRRMQFHRRGNMQGGEQPSWMVSKMWDVCGELCPEP